MFFMHDLLPTVAGMMLDLATVIVATTTSQSRYIEERLELLDQQPLVGGDVCTIELFEGINRLPRDERVEHVFLFELAAVKRLIGAFDFYGYGRLALFADRDRLVLSFDSGSVTISLCRLNLIREA